MPFSSLHQSYQQAYTKNIDGPSHIVSQHRKSNFTFNLPKSLQEQITLIERSLHRPKRMLHQHPPQTQLLFSLRTLQPRPKTINNAIKLSPEHVPSPLVPCAPAPHRTASTTRRPIQPSLKPLAAATTLPKRHLISSRTNTSLAAS